MATLYPWQVPLADRLEGILQHHAVAAVALPTGAGKTYISSEVMRRRQLRPLIIAPKSILTMWNRTVLEFGVTPHGVLNWEKIRTNKTQWFDGKAWHLPEGCVVILDEAHKGLSGADTATGKAVALLKGYSSVSKILMSATPAATPLHLRHTGYLLDLHTWGPASWSQFLKSNNCYFDRAIHNWRAPRGMKLATTMADINKRVSDKVLYMRIDDIPGFPECQLQCELLDLDSALTAEQINAVWAEASERMKKPGASQQAEKNKAMERTEALKIPLYADLVRARLAEGLSVCVFLNYREPLFRLQALLGEVGVTNVSMVFGAQDTGDSTKNRDAEIAKFQANENHVCLLTTGSGGVGISLHDLKHERARMAYLNPGNNASDIVQALGRIRRAGGTDVVQSFVLAADTVEEKTYRNLKDKMRSIEALVDKDLDLTI